VFEQLSHECRNESDHRRSLLAKQCKENGHVPRIRDQHHTSADGQADILRDRHAKDVKERERREKALDTLGRREPADQLLYVGCQIAVTQFCAFG
jgi:hypothetical protein